MSTDCKTHKVVVKGEKADPIKVLERVQRKSHRQVELLSPIPKPPAEEKKPEEKEQPKPEEKKEEVLSSLKPFHFQFFFPLKFLISWLIWFLLICWVQLFWYFAGCGCHSGAEGSHAL